MSGFETILKIRETNNKIPILANTAGTCRNCDINIQLQCGCNDCIIKPFDENTFMNKVNKFLNVN